MGKTYKGKAKEIAKKRKQVQRRLAKAAKLSAVLLALFCGCSTGTTARFEQRRVVGITSASLGEYTVPVLSIGEGPSATVWQSRACGSAITITGEATTTNTTSALGIWSSEEQKTFRFSGTFHAAPTNAPSVSE